MCCRDGGSFGQSLPCHRGAKIKFVLQPSTDEVRKCPPEYLNPLTGEKSRAPGAGEPSAPKRAGPLSSPGVSAILSCRRRAEGSRLANESKTRCSTPRGDVGTEAAPWVTRAGRSCRGWARSGSVLRKSQRGGKKPNKNTGKSPSSKPERKQRGSDGCYRTTAPGCLCRRQSPALLPSRTRTMPCPQPHVCLPRVLLAQEKGQTRSRARRERSRSLRSGHTAMAEPHRATPFPSPLARTYLAQIRREGLHILA